MLSLQSVGFDKRQSLIPYLCLVNWLIWECKLILLVALIIYHSGQEPRLHTHTIKYISPTILQSVSPSSCTLFENLKLVPPLCEHSPNEVSLVNK